MATEGTRSGCLGYDYVYTSAVSLLLSFSTQKPLLTEGSSELKLVELFRKTIY